MQEPTFLVLTALAGEALHGYGIMRAIDELSGGAVAVRPGTLYAALDRLTQEGSVEVDREEEWGGGRVRRYYRLTNHGARTLRVESERRRDMATAAIGRLDALGDRPRLRPA